MSAPFTVFDCLELSQMPDHDMFFSLSNDVCTLLENEDPFYRSLDNFGDAGSLVELKLHLPVIIVPDIHSRPDFVKNILNYKIGKLLNFEKNLSIYNALEQNLIYLVCVGDGVHTELTKDRWIKIQEETDKGNMYSDEMKSEMISYFSVLSALMKLKNDFPKNFHFLKGNHENVLNATEDGDFAFVKYSDEGELCRNFISNYYGDDILYLIHYYEKTLPLVAYSKSANCVISHAEPASFYFKGDIINARLYPEVVAGLTWTINDQVKENTASFLMKNLLNPELCNQGFYFAGHRPVKENYALRQNGQFIQIHNPRKQNICFVIPGQEFDPDKNIVSVN